MSRPLSYASWEAILPHFEFNKRLRIVLHCPELQTLDRQLGAKASNVDVVGTTLEIDKVKYSISTVYKNVPEKRHKEMRPKMVQVFQVKFCRERYQHGELHTGSLGFAEVSKRSLSFAQNYLMRKLLSRIRCIGTATVHPVRRIPVQTDIDLSLLASAKLLRLTHFIDNEIMVALRNCNVFCEYVSEKHLAKILITDWQQKNYSVGRKYKLFFIFKSEVAERYEYITSIPGGTKGRIPGIRTADSFPHCITFALSPDSELNVYCVEGEGDLLRMFDSVFYLTFEINPKGHAQCL